MTIETAKEKLEEAIRQREDAKRDRNQSHPSKRAEAQKKVDAATLQRDRAMFELETLSKKGGKKGIANGE